MSEIRPRMYPVFFGESIEVNPEPVQEIRYRWYRVGEWGCLSFSWCFFFSKNLNVITNGSHGYLDRKGETGRRVMIELKRH